MTILHLAISSYERAPKKYLFCGQQSA